MLEIVNFLKNYVYRKHICFYSGAFVFEDPKHLLYEQLRNMNGVYPRISSHSKHFIKKNENIEGYGKDFSGINIECNSKLTKFKTILFFKYSMNNPKTKRLKQFTYVKLEQHGFKSIKDIVFHSISYISTRFDSKKLTSKRAEKIKINDRLKNYVHKHPNLAKDICKAIPECTNNKQFTYTKLYRKGNEIYIPKFEYAFLIK